MVHNKPQGDPLSPYLFLFAAEGLSSLLVKVEAGDGRISGVPIAAGGTRLSHLFFADNSLLFCRANFSEWCNLSHILEAYERASGQQLNAAKTTIFFSKSTRSNFKRFICTTVGVSATTRIERYLGLPALVGKSKTKAFAGICDRVKKELDGWKEKFLSQAGKEILIKAVTQAIPTYSMNVFQLPKALCKTLNSLMSRFWWGYKPNLTKVPWMSWKCLGTSKHCGGMGFRDLEVFNRAFLAKQGWRLMSCPESLLARILREKYYPGGVFLEARMGSCPSFAWRSITGAKRRWKIGWVGE